METGAGQPQPKKMNTKPCCKKDLLKLYGISYKALASWLRPMKAEIGPLHGRYFSTAQLKIIFETFGFPEEINQ
ncbi:MAG: hypothetical protein QM737_16115 [Ferruginibacter sp.]